MYSKYYYFSSQNVFASVKSDQARGKGTCDASEFLVCIFSPSEGTRDRNYGKLAVMLSRRSHHDDWVFGDCGLITHVLGVAGHKGSRRKDPES